MSLESPQQPCHLEFSDLRGAFDSVREILLANTVMASEIPSPTFGEDAAVRYLHDRFNEAGLIDVSRDEAGSVAAVLPGATGERNILVSAHVDKIWPAKEDHTISVTTDSMSGRGVADNSLGVAVLASLPILLEKLGIRFGSNLILLGNTCSFGRGDLRGMRFFLENARKTIDSAICLEGIQLGRLSYSSLGMFRAEIEVTIPETEEWEGLGQVSAIATLNRIIDGILAIERPERPKTAILLGSVEAGSGYNVPPSSGRLRFEVRSENAEVVEKIRARIEDIVEEARDMDQCEVGLDIVAQRAPGDIGFDHPLVREARRILKDLDIKTRIAPSISELSALLDKGIPALTVGVTYGDNRHDPDETIDIEPIGKGLAQVLALLQFMDKSPDCIAQT